MRRGAKLGNALTWREVAMVSTIVPNRATKPSATLALHEARTVSSAVSNRATRDMRIRRCGKSQLKERKKLAVMASLFRVISGYYTARVTLPLRRQRVHA